MRAIVLRVLTLLLFVSLPPQAARAVELIWPVCDVSRTGPVLDPEMKATPSVLDSPWWRLPARKIYLDFGTPVHASGAGVVIAAERRGPFGLMIDVQHQGSLFTRYGHLQSLLIKAGDRVALGQKIATVGSTGRSTRPGLYFAIHDNLELIDPLAAGSEPPCKGEDVVLPPPQLRGTTPLVAPVTSPSRPQAP
jgi:murein DD-endopeptidase MepM/ murein hydrolase activator NlpD